MLAMTVREIPFLMIVIDFGLLNRNEDAFLQKLVQLSELPKRQGICIQLRVKGESPELCRRLASRCREHFGNEGVALLWNGDYQLADELGYEGCHYPENQISAIQDHRSEFLQSASIHSLASLKEAEEMDVDFVVFGSVYQPDWKQTQVVGLDALKCIVEKAQVPVLGIGGIQEENLAEIKSIGVHGIACASSIVRSPKPGETALDYMDKWHELD